MRRQNQESGNQEGGAFRQQCQAGYQEGVSLSPGTVIVVIMIIIIVINFHMHSITTNCIIVIVIINNIIVIRAISIVVMKSVWFEVETLES